MTNVIPLPVRRRSRPTTAGIAQRDSEKQPDSVTVGAYSGKLAEKDPDCGPTGHRTCPAPNTIESDLSGGERNPPKPKSTAISKGERSCGPAGQGTGNVSVLQQDTRSLPQQHRPAYSSWRSMKSRASRLGHEVDPSWLGVDGFARFLRDMGPRPNAEYTLDRIDSSLKEYGPGLCRWASKKTQTQNRRNTIMLTDASGVCRPLGEWAVLVGVKPDTMLKRIDRSWDDHDVIHGRESPARPQESTTGRWPPVSERAVECWKKMYVNRVWKKESRLDFVHRTATETLRGLWGTGQGEGELEYLTNLVHLNENIQNTSPEAVAAADRLKKLSELYHLMTVARDWAHAGLRERLRRAAEVDRAQAHARKWVPEGGCTSTTRRRDEEDEDDED